MEDMSRMFPGHDEPYDEDDGEPLAYLIPLPHGKWFVNGTSELVRAIFDAGLVGQLSEHAEGVLGWMLQVREAAKGVNDELED